MRWILVGVAVACLGWIWVKTDFKQGLYYQEICVDGVVYLLSGNGYLTPKVNKDFYPYVCAMKKEQNNG